MPNAYNDSTPVSGLGRRRSMERLDRELDDAIEDSFPASDPVSLAMPHGRAHSPRSGTAMTVSSALPFLVIGGVIAALLLRRAWD